MSTVSAYPHIYRKGLAQKEHVFINWFEKLAGKWERHVFFPRNATGIQRSDLFLYHKV